ncbi:hypothetical protein TOPH_08274 [Tolypocladium ophioglossoides CBS 100239]|uniref:Uncharacterized protein n=1 Tax=Tolypocladium ophioglossoides (strain CBS 100239) TaxID=1163406 RepID=A0A0L0MYX3_TOLOC|nr:hypothetical protein TOPH_08274 [Tolypocladium ophioglossoides CBS 100239]
MHCGSTTSNTCVPTTSVTPVCPKTLPAACSSLETSNGLNLLVTIPLCTVALGTFAVGDTAKCLITSGITFRSSGASIVTCLNNALRGNCITALPAACVRLTGLTGANLVTNLGIPLKACVSSLPPACASLGAITGTGLIAKLPACVTALGTYATGAVATCLNPANILSTTQGSTIVTCLLDALKGVCITTLPAACTKLATDSAAQLVTDIPLCDVALGPFAAGAAATCLTTSTGLGQDIVNCLTSSLFVTTRKRVHVRLRRGI